MSKSQKPQQPTTNPAPGLLGAKPNAGLAATGLGGGSLGAPLSSGGLYGNSGNQGQPNAKAGGKPARNAAAKSGQKPGGKPTGVPRRTAG
jgi:hypothetical protein